MITFLFVSFFSFFLFLYAIYGKLYILCCCSENSRCVKFCLPAVFGSNYNLCKFYIHVCLAKCDHCHYYHHLYVIFIIIKTVKFMVN